MASFGAGMNEVAVGFDVLIGPFKNESIGVFLQRVPQANA
jgi:hypothetical protein